MTTDNPTADAKAGALPSALTYADIEAADAAYSGFPALAAWAGSVTTDQEEWARHLARLQHARDMAPDDAANRAVQFAVRAAALDSGAIEGLYQVDRGFTFAVAAESATWQMEMAERGEQIRALFDAHLQAYELVLDAATKNTPLSEAWIRRLHEVICKPQTPAGY